MMKIFLREKYAKDRWIYYVKKKEMLVNFLKDFVKKVRVKIHVKTEGACLPHMKPTKDLSRIHKKLLQINLKKDK